MALSDELDPLTWDAAYWIVDLEDPDLPLDEMGEAALELEVKLTGIGIIRLLGDADSDAFLHNCMRAGLVWKAFLERCLAEEGGKDDHNFVSGLFAPFLDALAARDWPLAAQLALLPPKDYREGHEHESDHAYARALFELFKGNADRAVFDPLCDQCSDAGDETSRARAEVLRAMADRDQAAFDGAFTALVDVRRRSVQADVARRQMATPAELTHREVYVEGVALLNLAERLGLDTSATYPLCPALARMPMGQAFPGLR